ncbi:enoyl-CoA hydratase/isomerase family protein, partial [Pseudomonas sp. 5S3]
CGLADWYLNSEVLPQLDQQLDSLLWNDNALKDLQNLLAKNAVQQLPDAPLEKLRPVIDHFFGQPNVQSIIEQLREVTVA